MAVNVQTPHRASRLTPSNTTDNRGALQLTFQSTDEVKFCQCFSLLNATQRTNCQGLEQQTTAPVKTRQQPGIYRNTRQCDFYHQTNGIILSSRYGFARVLVSTPDHNWEFGNDQIVNDISPMPCADEDSKDIGYIRKIMEWISSQPDTFDSSSVYSGGFSQNSMFSAYIGTCFADQFKGVWQAGSGLILKGKKPYVPNCGGQLAASQMAECGKSCGQCVRSYTCEECQYWPIYPCYSPSHPLAHCIAEYTNDPISVGQEDPESLSSARNMYERSLKEGHEARLLRFAPSDDNTIKGNHKSPKNNVYWKIGCLGVTAPCSTECEASFVKCVGDQAASTALEQTEAFDTCIDESKFGSLSGCTMECAPTYNMLASSETPTTAEFATFGAASPVAGAQPSDSVCSH